jgi:tyrosyl-tRNA synthetase
MAQTTVQQLIERDMFQERIKKGQPIFGHEIMYPLLQGFDSVAMDVDLEIGGTDQTFNMMMGRQLQKTFNHREKWVLTVPIINGTDGRKMSKSYHNFVALTDQPNDMYGKLMSISDAQIVEYFTLLTDTPDEEIDHITQNISNGANPMPFKKQLAHTITQMYHSREHADAAQAFFERTVQEKTILPEDTTPIDVHQLPQELSLLELLHACMPEETNTELKRLIEQGAVTLLPDEQKPLQFFAIIDRTKITLVKVGKRRYFSLQS